jgi:hypothetical protein
MFHFKTLVTLLFVCLTCFGCEKDDKTPLTATLTGGWYAESVTQNGIDVTPAYQYSISFDTKEMCSVQRVWLGVYSQFICTYTIDEDKDQLFITNPTWNLSWTLVESDFGTRTLTFNDDGTSAATVIVLKSL